MHIVWKKKFSQEDEIKIVEQLPLSEGKYYKYTPFNLIDRTKFSIQSRFEKCLEIYAKILTYS